MRVLDDTLANVASPSIQHHFAARAALVRHPDVD